MRSYYGNDFGKWVGHRLIELNLTIDELACDLGIPRRTVQRHIHGQIKPSNKILRKYAEYFHAPLVSLFGHNQLSQSNEFGKWLSEQMSEHDYTVDELSELMSLSSSTIRRHLSGAVIPTWSRVKSYCRAFDITDLESILNVYDISLRDKRL